MDYENLFWWISLLGSIASLIGFPVAIWQIVKTRRIAEITKQTTFKTQTSIFRNLLLSDASSCTKYLEEIKSHIRLKEYKFAQSRISDVISQLLQIQEFLKTGNPTYTTNFEQILRRLSIIRNDLEKNLADNSVKIDMFRVNSQIAIIQDDLNKLIGEAKIVIEEGE